MFFVIGTLSYFQLFAYSLCINQRSLTSTLLRRFWVDLSRFHFWIWNTNLITIKIYTNNLQCIMMIFKNNESNYVSIYPLSRNYTISPNEIYDSTLTVKIVNSVLQSKAWLNIWFRFQKHTYKVVLDPSVRLSTLNISKSIKTCRLFNMFTIGYSLQFWIRYLGLPLVRAFFANTIYTENALDISSV